MILQMSTVAFAAPSIPEATSDFYVNDFAGVFSEEEKLSLMDRAVDLANTTDGIQVVISTVTSLDGNTVEDYANAMYNQYEIGRNDMGLLILLSTGDRKVRVEVGKAMEAYFNDAKAGRFIDNYAIPKLKDNKFNEGLISLQTELINEIRICIDKENATAEASNVEESKPITINWSAIVLLATGIVIISGFILIGIIIYKKTKKIQELERNIAKLVDDGEKANKRYEHQLDMIQANNQTLIMQISNVEEEKRIISEEIAKLKDRYNRVSILYPTADQDVTNMIEEEIRQRDIATAAKVDTIIEEVLKLTADRSIIPKIQRAQREYNALSHKQVQYVKADLNRLNDLYEHSMELQYQFLASEVTDRIRKIITRITIAKESDIDALKKAKCAYDNLPTEAKKHVDSRIHKKVSNLLSQAERDKEERKTREEEECRKRRQQEEEERRGRYNNNNRFGGGSSGGFGGFGGFGGHSGGGGASRGF